MNPSAGIIVAVLVVTLILLMAQYKWLERKHEALEVEYRWLRKRTNGLYEIAHYPEALWLPRKEWGEDVNSALNRVGK